MIIKTVKLKDIEKVLEIEKLSFQDPWTKSMFIPFLEGKYSYFFVVKKSFSFQILGYIIFDIIFDEMHILNLAVHLEHRKKNIGKFILKHSLNFALAKKIKKIFLEVRASNYIAQKLYKKFGFIEISKRKQYYSNKEDAIVMSIPNLFKNNLTS